MNEDNPVKRYLLNHWKGRLPLWQAFWINLVAIAVIPHFLIEWLVPDWDKLPEPFSLFIIAPAILAYALVFAWQAVGLLRTTDQYIRDVGAMMTAWGAQLGLLAVVWIVLVNIWGLWLTTGVIPETENFEERMEREHASKYNLEIAEDGLTIYLRGEITLGVTRKFEGVLADNPNLQTMVLDSDGGNIYEGRGLAKLIREASMNTRVDTECSSACTLAFIGGMERRLFPGAKLGFHQYRVDADYLVAFADPEAEQGRDKALFASAGVSEDFLVDMYEKAAGDMWFPTAQELFDAGVITSLPQR